jgi:hypothetical protein
MDKNSSIHLKYNCSYENLQFVNNDDGDDDDVTPQ